MARSVSATSDGRVEVVVARNATKEVAWRVVPIPACPARGHEPGVTTATISVWWPGAPTPSTLVDDCIRFGPNTARGRLQQLVGPLVRLRVEEGSEASGLEVLALKPAGRGDGIIVRCIDWDHRPGRRILLHTTLPLIEAHLCDVRERDLDPVELRPRPDGTELLIEMDTAISSIRLLPKA